MNLVGVPSEFRGRVSDDGRQVFLAGMQLPSVPEWPGNLTALTTLDLSGNQLASPVELGWSWLVIGLCLLTVRATAGRLGWFAVSRAR